MNSALTVDIGSEGGVLGSMLLDRETIPVIREILRDKFFLSKIEHQILFEQLCLLHDKMDSDTAWDLVLVRSELIANGLLDAIGGVEYLIRLCESTPSPANAKFYAINVRSAYQRKQIVDMGTSLGRIATEPSDLHETVNNALSDLQELSADIDDSPKLNGADAVKSLIEESIAGCRKIIHLPWRMVSSLSNALQPGSVTLLCGTPGASKSFAALEIIQYVLREGHTASYYALEDSKAFHLARMLAQKTGLSGLTNPEWIHENPIIATAAHQENEKWLIDTGRLIEASSGGQATYSDLSSWLLKMARFGCKVLIIDPVTAIRHTSRQTWAEDNDFLQRIKRTAVDYGCSVLLVTHPAKCEGRPSMEMLAGGASFSRFAQTIFWLEYHEQKTSDVRFDCGTADTSHNRTLHILKARLGKGQGVRVAMTFTDNLILKEHGVIVKKKKRNNSDDE